MAVWASFISAALGILAGGAATYFTTRAQLRMEAEHVYDRSLRDLRLPHYQRLFHLTRVMPREWLPSTIPCKADVILIRESLRDWYFGEESGGMFLSQPARDQYFRLYYELESAIAGLRDDAESPSREGAAELRQRTNALRHQLVADLGVAERPRTKWFMPAEKHLPPITE
ncbi:MAG: hypothetical protein ACRDN1_00420 [Trebonia sp.]